MISPDNAIQDQLTGNHCFGCGAGNHQGLRIKSFWLPATRSATCTYHPAAYQCSGSPRFLNGGISASVIDCHSVCTAIADAYASAGYAPGDGEPLWYATGEMTLKYKRPVPISAPIVLEARVVDSSPKRTLV
ncbi:MAG: PaaI family thioesterase, partial [Spongiibacter sp.]|nr:PaaI family thioesterase [Spongiibacter sp.]